MKISIITPNFNYSRYIGQTIQSIIEQGYSNFELIIVDDGSTDNSVQVIKEYTRAHPDKIKLYTQENKGQTHALNKALKHTTGDLIAWINSDDYYYPGAFKAIIQSFKNNLEADAIFGDIIIVDDAGNKIKHNRYLKFDYASGIFNGFGRVISSNAIFWKSDLSKSIKPFNEDYKIGMDSEYWSRLLYNRRVKHISYPIAHFRWHSEAKTIRRSIKTNKEYLWGQYENRQVFRASYSKLRISRFLPPKYAAPIKYSYKMKRHLLRFLHGHYFRKT